MSHRKYVIIRKSEDEAAKDAEAILSSAKSYVAKDIQYKKRDPYYVSEAVWNSYTQDERERILKESQVIVYLKNGKAR